MMKKDDKAFIFYFLMTIIFFDFGNQIKKLSYHSFFENFNNPIFSIVHANNTGSAFSLFQNQANGGILTCNLEIIIDKMSER